MKYDIETALKNYKRHGGPVVITLNKTELDRNGEKSLYLRGQIYNSSTTEFEAALRAFAKRYGWENISTSGRGI